MCPSFRVTREEEHSTRGRAHLLWEMTQGEVIRDGWQDERVKESLDLCLACKGCKSDCPVGVDVATYKAEFLSHYYEDRLRPPNPFAFGNIDLLARLASHVPGFVNLTTQLPFLSEICKTPRRNPAPARIPAFAPQTFKSWFARRKPKEARPYRSPPLGRHLQQLFPARHRQGRRRSSRSRRIRRPASRRATSAADARSTTSACSTAPRLSCWRSSTISCPKSKPASRSSSSNPVAPPSFATNSSISFPTTSAPAALSQQTFLLSEFLEKYAKNFQLPPIARKALIHGHCHHKAIMKMTAEEAVLTRMGIDFYAPAPGCCGMAGAFGFEKDKYEVSRDIGELELLPAVRDASPETLIIADGFSCREQIAQETNRHALHLAEVIQMGLRAARRANARRVSRTTHRSSPPASGPGLDEAESAWAIAGLAAAACAAVGPGASR